MKLSEIARKLGCGVEGPQDTEITGVAGIDHAKPGHVTFLANRRYFPLLKTTQASAVLLQAGITLERAPGVSPISALRSENPYLDFARTPRVFIPPPLLPRARKSAKAPTSAPTALWTKTRKSAATRFCTASSLCTEVQKLARTFLPTRMPWFGNFASSVIASFCKMEWLSAATVWASQNKKTAVGTKWRNPARQC